MFSAWYDISYRDFKDLPRKTASDKVLRDKAFNISENPKYDEYQIGLASMVYKFFDKKSASPADKSASGGAIKNENMSNEELAEELHKPIIRKFKKTFKKFLKNLKVYLSFQSYVCGAHLADMQLISKFNKGICFLLRVIDIFSKYAWVIPLKDKKRTAITNVFQKILDESNRKLNKIWVDKDS